MAGDRSPVTVSQASFDNGLNLQRDDYAGGLESALRSAVNARLTVFGRVQRRRGTTRMHPTALPAPIQGMLPLIRPAEAQRLCVVSNGNLYVHSGDPISPLTLTAVTSGTTIVNAATAPLVSMVAFRDGSATDVLYLADGGALMKYNPLASPQLQRVAGSPTDVSFIWSYNNRLMGVTGKSEKLYASALGNGDSLGQASGVVANVRTFGDGVLTAGVTQAGRSIMFHETGISAFTGVGLGDIAIAAGTNGITTTDGTRAPRSVVVADQSVYFWSTDRGPCVLKPTGVVEPIGLMIRPLYQRLAKSITAGVVAVHAPREYEIWWLVPTIGIMIYNYALNAWAGPWTGGYLTDQPTVFASIPTDTQTDQFILYGTSSGWVVSADVEAVFADNLTSAGTGGEMYETEITLPVSLWTDGIEHATPLRVGIVMARQGSSNGTLTVRGWRDEETQALFSGGFGTGGGSVVWDGGSAWDDGSTWDASNVDVVYRRVKSGLAGPWVQVSFRDSGNGDSYLTRVTVEGVRLGRRGEL